MSESLDPGVSLTWRLLRYRWLITISTAVLAVDQGTKAWIRARLPFNTYGEAAGAIRVVRGFLYIVHVGNTGAAWSILTGRSILLAALAAATLAAIFFGRRALGLGVPRSEEHTSELLSLRHLVCRLLLEKINIELLTQGRSRDRFYPLSSCC